MLHYISGDVTTLSGSFVLCQQVNCQAVMGAGLALAIRKKWPQVYTDYVQYCHSHCMTQLLGHIQTSTLTKNQYICNIFGQYYYGRCGKYTDEAALLSALHTIFQHAAKAHLHVFIPMKIGAGLAGGNLATIQDGIQHLAATTKADVYLVDYAPIAIHN